MRENFLYYIWKHKKLDVLNLKTTQGLPITIVKVGDHNTNSGPDFFNAHLLINEQLWVGNIEMHVKSSDWYAHGHDTDLAYDNVILHIVWEYDADIKRKDQTIIPTLVLKKFIAEHTISNYHKLFAHKTNWINCEFDLVDVDNFIIFNWLERVYFDRLERKEVQLTSILESTKFNWEATLFNLLSKNFGLAVNGEAFQSMSNSIDFKIVRKCAENSIWLEALFMGQLGLLEGQVTNDYYQRLQENYRFLKSKYKLNSDGVLPTKFFRLRPPNFPTIRLSQLATLYTRQPNLFSKILKAKSIEAYYSIFKVKASKFWTTHYTFESESKPLEKTVTNSFIDLLIINTVIPIKYAYAKQQGRSIDEELLNLISSLRSEQNRIVNKFNTIKKLSSNAMHSQALIELKTKYCNENKCLQCAVGNVLLSQN